MRTYLIKTFLIHHHHGEKMECHSRSLFDFFELIFSPLGLCASLVEIVVIHNFLLQLYTVHHLHGLIAVVCHIPETKAIKLNQNFFGGTWKLGANQVQRLMTGGGCHLGGCLGHLWCQVSTRGARGSGRGAVPNGYPNPTRYPVFFLYPTRPDSVLKIIG